MPNKPGKEGIMETRTVCTRQKEASKEPRRTRAHPGFDVVEVGEWIVCVVIPVLGVLAYVATFILALMHVASDESMIRVIALETLAIAAVIWLVYFGDVIRKH